MKKVIVLVLSLILLTTIVSAHDDDEIVDADYLRGMSWATIREHYENQDDWVQFRAILREELIQSDIDNNRDMWAKDDSGMSSRSLSEWLTGNPDIFDDYGTFMNYLYLIFAEKEATDNRMDTLTAMIELNQTKVGPEVIVRAGIIKSGRLKKTVKLANGLVCNYKKPFENCVLFTQIKEKEIEVPQAKIWGKGEKEEFLLNKWKHLCEIGIPKYCRIVERYTG